MENKQYSKDMKKLVFMVCAALLMLVSCQSRENEALMKKSSSGKTCEVLLAADDNVYRGDAKVLIDSIFRAPQDGLPQCEPRFDMVRITVDKLNKTQMFRMHRNIVTVSIDATNDDKVHIARDQYAAPQVVINVAAKSDTSLLRILRQNEPIVINAIYGAEHLRIENAFYNQRNVELMNRFKEKFGFRMTFSDEFRWAAEDADFAWIRKETKDFGLSVLVTTMPYRSQDQFVYEKIDNRLDTMMRRHVPGPAEGSYMGTERRVELQHRRVEYPGSQYCVETRGLWRTFGDFMGGPFVSYTILSLDNTQIVEVVGFVYCPRFDKRDYLMQVEGICNSIKWE